MTQTEGPDIGVLGARVAAKGAQTNAVPKLRRSCCHGRACPTEAALIRELDDHHIKKTVQKVEDNGEEKQQEESKVWAQLGMELALDNIMPVEDGFEEAEVTKCMTLMGSQDKYDNKIMFPIGKSTPFKKLTDACCKITGRNVRHTWFSGRHHFTR